MHDSSSESDSISLVVTNRNLDTQQSQYFDALDTIEENEEESTDDDLSDLDVSFSMTKMISIPIGEIYAQVAKSAISYYSLIVLPLTNFTLHPLTCCVIDKGIKGLV